jgi:hypothetical protein
MKKQNSYIISIRQMVAVASMLILLSGTIFISFASGSEINYGSISETPQIFTVTGKVTSAADNGTLPGVSIIVKGTTKGTISNTDGSYNIEVSGNDAILVFSFIGFQTTEVPVNGRKVVDIALTENVKALDEVVVTQGHPGKCD